MYADVVGYLRLAGEDEEATHRRLSEYLDLISTLIEAHRGRVMRCAGGCFLAVHRPCYPSYPFSPHT